jgi:tRNA A-37 threonylcarbamoyl transferase component Bud32
MADSKTDSLKFLDTSSATHAPIPIQWLGFARFVWAAVAIYFIGLFALGLPFQYDKLALTAGELAGSWLTPDMRIWSILIAESALVLVFAVAAGLIYAQRSAEVGTYLLSMMFITFSTTILFSMNALREARPEVWFAIHFAKALAWFLLLYNIYIFPDGRHEPRWTRMLGWGWLIWTLAWLFFPNLHINPTERFIFAELPIFLLYLSWFLSALLAQVYRYRKHASRTQQQQTKWVVYGFAIAIIGSFLQELPSGFFPELKEYSAVGLQYQTLSTLFFILAVLAVPIATLLSIQRKRLWDIDFIINRSIVYGLATLLSVSVYLGAAFGLRGLTSTILGGERANLSFVLALGLVPALFIPLQRSLRRRIDKRYGIHIRYKRKFLDALQLEPENVVIGDYVLEALIGRGGMAQVYRARHTRLGRPAAIKLLSPQLAERLDFRKRFEREAQTIAHLEHANIVQLYDFGEFENTYYMVMEYVPGKDLRGHLDAIDGHMGVPLALDLIGQIAGALDYAHSLEMVHRDVKPSNVLMEHITNPGDGRHYRPVLTDFGIVKLATNGTEITKTGIVGTFDYIAPEQIEASSKVDRRADIYALGVLSFLLLTGELPFHSPNAGMTLLAHLQQPAPDPRRVRPDLSSAIALALHKALEKAPEARHDSAGAFAADLRG